MSILKSFFSPLKTSTILIIVGIIVFLSLQAEQTTNIQDESKSETILSESIERIEIPARISGRKEQIIERLGFTISYNSHWKIPNWVAYELTKEEVGGVTPRGKHFIPDPDVPVSESATVDDYRNSGWDRGHIAPAADMKWSEQAMKESFYFSNICPQNNNLNAGVWKDLEEQVRKLALEKGNIYIVAGPLVSEQPNTIGGNKVAVPDAFFKVLLQNDKGNWSAIAFLFANESGRKPLSAYAMTVKEIQIIANIDFFPTLPDSIEEKVESQLDFTKWNIRTGK